MGLAEVAAKSGEARVRVLHLEPDSAHHVAVNRSVCAVCPRLEFALVMTEGAALNACVAEDFDVVLIEPHLHADPVAGLRVVKKLRAAKINIPAIVLAMQTLYPVVARCAELAIPFFPKACVDFNDLAVQLLAAASKRSSSGTFARLIIPTTETEFAPERPSGVRLRGDDPIREAAYALLRAKGSLKERVDQVESLFVQEFVRAKCDGNRSEAAVQLVTTRQTIQRKLRGSED